MIAQLYGNSAYSKWGRIAVRSGLTGAQAAQRLISSGGLSGVRLERIAGKLTDHYDPRDKVLRLSQGVADTPSIAAVAVAAHELGHAMQDSQDYAPLRFRAALVPMVNIGSWLGWIMIFAGLLLGVTQLPGRRAGILGWRDLCPGDPACGSQCLESRQATAGRHRHHRRRG